MKFRDSDLLMLITMGWHVSPDRTTAHKVGECLNGSTRLMLYLVAEPPGWRSDYPEGSYLLTKHRWGGRSFLEFSRERTGSDLLWLVSSWQTRQSLGTPTGQPDCLHPYLSAGDLVR